MKAAPAKATAQQVREHYNFFAHIYRLFWGEHIHHGLFLNGIETPEEAQLLMLEHCVQLAGLQPKSHVLDVGCGHGGTAVYLAHKYDCTVRGLTISEKQAKRARQRAKAAGVAERVEVKVADADHYDFPRQTYDAVWTMESSEHFTNKGAYFQHVGQTLKPGGALLLAAWTGDMRRERVRAVAHDFLCPELLTAEQYAKQIEAAGLKIRQQEDLSAKVQRTWEICQQRARKARPLVLALPARHRRFVEGIDLILEAYRSGELTYTVIAANKA